MSAIKDAVQTIAVSTIDWDYHKLVAVLRSWKKGEKHWDDDIQKLDEIGAMEILSRILNRTAEPVQTRKQSLFYKSLDKCERITQDEGINLG